MPEFAVWAPKPERVELQIELPAGEKRLPMDRSRDGWWRVEVPDAGVGAGAGAGAGPGATYGFCLDGGKPLPDPRSAFQPDGVEGLSRIVDHDSFAWSDERWHGVPARGLVLYELHVGTFTPGGTFDAVIERLPHLVNLGVSAIELLPVVEFSGARGWGYDGVDWFAPHHAYGGPQQLKRLIDACHKLGLGVVIDVVYNHLGPAGNYLDRFGPYFSTRHQTNWGPALNFDGPGSDEVRRLVIDNALMWLRDYHADGLRLDAVHAIVDDSAVHILEELATEVDALATHLGRPVFLIAESDLNDPRLVRGRDAGGFGLDAAWADEWHHALHAAFTGDRDGYYEEFGSLKTLAKALRQAWVYDGIWSPYRRRRHGRSPTGLSGYQFVICTQNHDQVGNRALGDRLSALTSRGRLKVAAALLLTGPFTPMLFQGEEWAAGSPFQYFTDHADPELAGVVSEGRRREFAAFGWQPDEVPDPQAPGTFARSRLDWAELDRPAHADVLAWYRQLIGLRRTHPALSDPRLDRITVDVDEAGGTMVICRGPISILVNLGRQPHRFPTRSGETVLAGSDSRIQVQEGGLLVPSDAVVLTEGPRRNPPM